VNLAVRSAFLPGSGDLFFGDMSAAQLYRARDREQGFEFRADRRIRVVETYGIHEVVIAAQVMRGGRAMAGLTEIAIVAGGDESSDHLPLAACERVRTAEQNFRQFTQRLRGLRAERERADDPR